MRRNWRSCANARCSKTEQEIAEQLNGHWREDHVFSLQQALKMYDAVQERIEAYEQEILRRLGEMEADEPPQPTAPPLQNTNKAKTIKKRGQEPKRQALYRMSGVDMTQIDAVGVETVEVVLSEYGPDLSRFPTEKQFVSHVTLAPRVPKSGGKPVKKKKRQQREHPCGSGFAHGGPVPAPQPDGLGSVLSTESRNDAGEILLSSLPPGSWPLLFTDCCDGDSHTSTKVQPHTKTAIANTASHVWPPQPNNSATS